jgi:hypothetical protein
VLVKPVEGFTREEFAGDSGSTKSNLTNAGDGRVEVFVGASDNRRAGIILCRDVDDRLEMFVDRIT